MQIRWMWCPAAAAERTRAIGGWSATGAARVTVWRFCSPRTVSLRIDDVRCGLLPPEEKHIAGLPETRKDRAWPSDSGKRAHQPRDVPSTRQTRLATAGYDADDACRVR